MMITGTIDQVGSPVVSITVYGNRNEARVDAVLDTGFSGHICLPISVAVPLGLELVDTIEAELADGTVLHDELEFDGKVLWDGKIVDITIILTKSAEPLIGTAMLQDSDVRLNYQTDEVIITNLCN